MIFARTDSRAEDHDSPGEQPAAQELDAPVSDDPWGDNLGAERDATATEQRVQTATWIEEILAEIG